MFAPTPSQSGPLPNGPKPADISDQSSSSTCCRDSGADCDGGGGGDGISDFRHRPSSGRFVNPPPGGHPFFFSGFPEGPPIGTSRGFLTDSDWRPTNPSIPNSRSCAIGKEGVPGFKLKETMLDDIAADLARFHRMSETCPFPDTQVQALCPSQKEGSTASRQEGVWQSPRYESHHFFPGKSEGLVADAACFDSTHVSLSAVRAIDEDAGAKQGPLVPHGLSQGPAPPCKTHPEYQCCLANCAHAREPQSAVPGGEDLSIVPVDQSPRARQKSTRACSVSWSPDGFNLPKPRHFSEVGNSSDCLESAGASVLGHLKAAGSVAVGEEEPTTASGDPPGFGAVLTLQDGPFAISKDRFTPNDTCLIAEDVSPSPLLAGFDVQDARVGNVNTDQSEPRVERAVTAVHGPFGKPLVASPSTAPTKSLPRRAGAESSGSSVLDSNPAIIPNIMLATNIGNETPDEQHQCISTCGACFCQAWSPTVTWCPSPASPTTAHDIFPSTVFAAVSPQTSASLDRITAAGADADDSRSAQSSLSFVATAGGYQGRSADFAQPVADAAANESIRQVHDRSGPGSSIGKGSAQPLMPGTTAAEEILRLRLAVSRGDWIVGAEAAVSLIRQAGCAQTLGSGGGSGSGSGAAGAGIPAVSRKAWFSLKSPEGSTQSSDTEPGASRGEGGGNLTPSQTVVAAGRRSLLSQFAIRHSGLVTLPSDGSTADSTGRTLVHLTTSDFPVASSDKSYRLRQSPPQQLQVVFKVADFANLCAALFACWPGLPPGLEHYPTVKSPTNIPQNVRTMRTLCLAVQNLLLAGLSNKLGLSYYDQRVCKHIAMITVANLGRTNDSIVAFGPLFFDRVNGFDQVEMEFVNQLQKWQATGILQKVFEAFTIILARRHRWDVLLLLLSCAKNGGKRLLAPVVMNLTGEKLAHMLPEIGLIIRCRHEVLAEMCFPQVVLVNLLKEFCQRNDVIMVLSSLPLAIGVCHQDGFCGSRQWHIDAMNPGADPDVTTLTPEKVLGSLQVLLQSATIQDQTLRGSIEAPQEAEGVLDVVVASFLFLHDPKLSGEWARLVSEDPGLSLTCLSLHRGIHDPRHQKRVLELFGRVHESTQATERFYAVLEICSRITENNILQDKRDPVAELLELGNNTARESVLNTSRRTVAELTGCTLTHLEIYLMRILEAFDAAYGISSDLPGLVGPSKRFAQTITLSPFAARCFMEPIVNGKLMPSAHCCPNLRMSSADDCHGDDLTAVGAVVVEAAVAVGSPTSGRRCGQQSIDKNTLVFPTNLPIHIAQEFPAWFATRGSTALTFKDDFRQYIGWRALMIELFCCGCWRVPPSKPTALSETRIVAPHLTDDMLLACIKLYVDSANPRALHLLTRWTQKPNQLLDPGTLLELLSKAERSKFILLGEAIVQTFVFDNSATSMEIANRLVAVYFACAYYHDALLLIKSLGNFDCGVKLQEIWEQKLHYAIQNDGLRISKGPIDCPQDSSLAGFATNVHAMAQHTKATRWRKAVQILKGMSAVNSISGAVSLFWELHGSPGGIPDISVANKIIHICVAAGRVAEAEQLFQVLRDDAHQWYSERRQVDLGACGPVRPDVVTCNIILKGMSRRKPPRLDEMDRVFREMETQFELGGDGVDADHVTFNTIMNAAVTAGCFQKAWEFFDVMKFRGIKIDRFTCSILMKQIGPSTKPEFVKEVLQLLEELDPFDDPVLLSSMVDVYSRLNDFGRLKQILDRYQERMTQLTPYAIATLVKGYGRCEEFAIATKLWQKLESMPDIQWTQYLFGCGVDCFLSAGDLDQALATSNRATRCHVPLNDVQLSSLIRLCTQARRVQDALHLYREIRFMGLQPCDITYNNLMHLCVVSGDLETAVEILNDMSSDAKHQPDVITYSTVIKGLCDRGAMRVAMQLFEEIPKKGVQPDIVTYNTLLEGFAKAEDIQMVEELTERLLANNVRPTCYTLTILIKFYGRKHRLNKVLNLIETLPRKHNIDLDAFVYTATIAACTWNGRVDKAIEFLVTMRESFGASSRTYGTLIGGCMKQMTWPGLRQVLSYVQADKVVLGRRDVQTLMDLVQDWSNRRINSKWLTSGFDAHSAIQLRSFIAAQWQQSAMNGDSPNSQRSNPCLAGQGRLRRGCHGTK